MKLTKKLAVLGALAPLGALAEGTGGNGDVSSAVSQLQSAAEGAVSAVAPAVVAICVALFGIAAIVFAYRVIKARMGR